MGIPGTTAQIDIFLLHLRHLHVTLSLITSRDPFTFTSFSFHGAGIRLAGFAAGIFVRLGSGMQCYPSPLYKKKILYNFEKACIQIRRTQQISTSQISREERESSSVTGGTQFPISGEKVFLDKIWGRVSSSEDTDFLVIYFLDSALEKRVPIFGSRPRMKNRG